MSEKVKLIIEIPEELYDTIQADKMISREQLAVLQMDILRGTSLDDVKAEIEKKCDRINSIASVLRYPQHREIQELLCEILASIDKGVSE